MNSSIFREYDIRGVADSDMPDELITNLGRALGTFLRRKGASKIVLGQDCRLSSSRLHSALSTGLQQTGIHLLDIGVGPTPMMYFSVFHFDLDGGVQITGSHNPPEDNGFKMMAGKETLFGQDIQTLLRMIEGKDFELPGGGTVEKIDPIPAYAGYIKGNIAIEGRKITFAIDAGNGAGGPAALAAMHAVGLEPDPMFCDMDGNFPNHHPDPSLPENLAPLIKRVTDNNYDVGIAFDGDADRIGVIDARGDIIWGDKLLVLLSRALLKTHPGATIISEVKASQTLYDDIAKHGGRGILWKTGHSLIKKKMKEEGALLAGEMSGHVFYADRYFGFDDAIYTALRLIEILSSQDQPLHELIADLPKTYATPEIRVACPDTEKFEVVDRVKAAFAGKREIIDIDGVRILFEDGWGLVRASNTQPVLVLRFEATSEATLAHIRSEVEAAVKAASPKQ